MANSNVHTAYLAALNKLAKWRTVFAGWQLGTRSDTDPEAAAVRDAIDRQLVLRVETTALVRLLIEKRVFKLDEFERTVADEALELDKILEAKFPGFQTTLEGLKIDPRAAETMRGWRP